MGLRTVIVSVDLFDRNQLKRFLCDFRSDFSEVSTVGSNTGLATCSASVADESGLAFGLSGGVTGSSRSSTGRPSTASVVEDALVLTACRYFRWYLLPERRLA